MATRSNQQPFVTVADLAEQRDLVTLVDARAPSAFERGHLPGAVNLPARDLNPPVGSVRRLIEPAALRESLHRRGVGDGEVVVYGARGGSDAAHVWWTLHAYGHRAVYLLDGGIEAWASASHDIAVGARPARAPEAPFEPALVPQRRIELEELRSRLDDPSLALVDTRSVGEFRGHDVAARRGGHIPGALLIPWDALLAPDLRLAPRDECERRLAPLMQVPEVALYCQSGMRAAHTFAVLKGLGHEGPRLYLGSWGEWGNRDDTLVHDGVEVSV